MEQLEFNDKIYEIALLELLLAGCCFTWMSKRDEPTLACLFFFEEQRLHVLIVYFTMLRLATSSHAPLSVAHPDLPQITPLFWSPSPLKFLNPTISASRTHGC